MFLFASGAIALVILAVLSRALMLAAASNTQILGYFYGCDYSHPFLYITVLEIGLII